jgi:hypothetical protein
MFAGRYNSAQIQGELANLDSAPPATSYSATLIGKALTQPGP